MSLKLITNPGAYQADVYAIARAVYAETGASSLAAVEALCSMIANLARATSRSVADIVCDANVFGSRNSQSPHHYKWCESASSRGFQMCLRVARRMYGGGLRDTVRGAVRFHHADEIPEWATARGYIADIDGLLFYL